MDMTLITFIDFEDHGNEQRPELVGVVYFYHGSNECHIHIVYNYAKTWEYVRILSPISEQAYSVISMLKKRCDFVFVSMLKCRCMQLFFTGFLLIVL
jgi:hypothetical protein